MIGAEAKEAAIETGNEARDYLYEASGYGTVAPDMAKLKVVLRIRDLAEAVGIRNPYELSKRTGMPYESCRLIWSEGTRRIDLATIERLCETFGVIPGQLFKHHEIESESSEGDQPIPTKSPARTKKRLKKGLKS
jgi:DNA-binding Xre family transcriptional regulator